MAITVQTSAPSSFVVGDTTKWSRAYSGYTPGVNTLTAGFSGPTRFILTATEDPAHADRFLFTVGPSTNVKAGPYLLVIRATAAGGDVETLETLSVTALPQIGATDAELDTLEAQLALAQTAYNSLALKTRSSVSVDGVSYTLTTADTLRRHILYLERRIASLKATTAGLLGQSGGNLFVTRFRN